MNRLALPTFAMITLAGSLASAQAPAPAPVRPAPPAGTTAPAPSPRAPAKQATGTGPAQVGEALAINGAPGWPTKLEWLYDVPSFPDSSGKVVLHWFCAPKIQACTDDLARLITLKETGKVYIIAYINGTKADAKKLDPIRETEGVGRGTVAYGKGVAQIAKQMGMPSPSSIVVDQRGTIQAITTGLAPADLDARDAKIASMSERIREYIASSEGPKVVKPNDNFQLSQTIRLAPHLKYSSKAAPEWKLTGVPKDIKCDNTVLKGAQLKITDQRMVAQVTCSGARGVYELRGTLTFGYDSPTAAAATGIGTEVATWKFEIKPMGMQ